MYVKKIEWINGRNDHNIAEAGVNLCNPYFTVPIYEESMFKTVSCYSVVKLKISV